jgi:hypothetical protein
MQIQETIIDGIVYRNFIYEESDMATQSEKDSWLSVCNTCEFKQDDRCGSCGCILESIMAYKTATCPAGKW